MKGSDQYNFLKEKQMKLLQKPILVTATLAAIMIAGCGEHSKSDNVAQRDEQTMTPPIANDAGKMNGTATASVDDSMITTKVKAAIVAEPTLSAMDIKVKTDDGVVTLSGTIDTPDKADRAKQLAQTVDGVKTVNNELVVKSPS
jgi:hyperosmotically inducible protein